MGHLVGSLQLVMLAAVLAFGASTAGRHAADGAAEPSWRAAAVGIEVAELRLSPRGSPWRFRVHLVRVDPRLVALEVAANVDARGRVSPWTLDATSDSALLAVNGGHFDDSGPWGWVIHRGREHRPPGSGPLAMAIVVDSSGRVRLVDQRRTLHVRSAGGIAEAFQSYPALLVGDAQIPEQLRRDGAGIDLAHRDARLALGELRDGRLIFALTRLDAPGGDRLAIPIGPTVPEMADLMRSQRAIRAVLLDGGISAQLLVRDSLGTTTRYPGMRGVPLGFVGRARTH